MCAHKVISTCKCIQPYLWISIASYLAYCWNKDTNMTDSTHPTCWWAFQAEYAWDHELPYIAAWRKQDQCHQRKLHLYDYQVSRPVNIDLHSDQATYYHTRYKQSDLALTILWTYIFVKESYVFLAKSSVVKRPQIVKIHSFAVYSGPLSTETCTYQVCCTPSATLYKTCVCLVHTSSINKTKS